MSRKTKIYPKQFPKPATVTTLSEFCTRDKDCSKDYSTDEEDDVTGMGMIAAPFSVLKEMNSGNVTSNLVSKSFKKHEDKKGIENSLEESTKRVKRYEVLWRKKLILDKKISDAIANPEDTRAVNLITLLKNSIKRDEQELGISRSLVNESKQRYTTIKV